MKKLLFSFILLAGSYLQAQKIDSVLYNGSYYYVYPYAQKARASNILNELLFKDAFRQFQIESDGKADKFDKAKMKMVKDNADRFYQTSYNMASDIIPALDKLPDGKYIQYFDEYMTLDKNDRAVPNKTKVAGFFQLKNNLLEGKAYWLNVIGDTVKYGEFVHGAKEGPWTLLMFYHDRYYSRAGVKNFLKRKMTYNVVRSNYKQGTLNGPFEREIDGDLFEKGHYKDGKESGEWYTYNATVLNIGGSYVDTLLVKTHYILADKAIVSHKPYIRTILDYNYPHKYYTFSNYYEAPDTDFNTFWRMANTEEELDLPEEEINGYEGENYDEMYPEGEMMFYDGYYLNGMEVISKGKLIDSVGIINKYDGFYEEYYDNGQLKVRLEFANGNLVNEDTLFWDNGVAADVVLYHADTKTYENRKLDYKGVLYEVNLYDSLGNFLKQELDPLYRDKHIPIEGVDASVVSQEFVNFTYTANSMKKKDPSYSPGTYFKYENPDTLNYKFPKGKVLLSKTWYDDTTSWISLVYDADTRTLTEDIKSVNKSLVKSTTYEFDENFRSLRGQSVYRLKDLSLVSTFNGDYPAEYITPADTFPAMFATMYYTWFNLTKDPVLQYKNEPFSGKISLNLDASKTSFSIKKNQISIQVSAKEKFTAALEKDFINYRKTGKTKYPDILSVSQLMLSQVATAELFPFVADILALNYSAYDYDQYAEEGQFLRMEGARIEGNFLNGKPNGTWKIYSPKGKVLVECNFINGELNGKRKEYEYAETKSRMALLYGEDHPILQYNTFPSKTKYFLAKESEYKNGLQTGNTYTYDWQGKITSKMPYVDGYRSGAAFQHTPLISSYMSYEDGEIDGIAKSYLHFPGSDSILLYELNFQRGLLQGESKSYHTNGKISQRGFFLNGMPIDDYEGYDSLGTRFHYVKFLYSFPVEEKIWEANQLSVRYQFDWRDSIMFRPEGLNESSSVNDLLYSHNLLGDTYEQPYYGRPSLVEKTGIEYHMTKYFPNDTVSRDGVISSGKKIGCWQFFSYEGEKLYDVEYYDTLIRINDSIQFKSKGLLTDYDAKGNPLSKSFIIEKFEKYDCSHTDHYEIRQFYTTWQAHDSLHRINGYVKNYYDNGTIQSEGNMKNGLPTGIWKIYDPFGKLHKVGEYVMGKRDGRWLSGDLSKTKYLGDICMNPNLPDLEAQIKYQEKLLDIYIEYFKTGKLLNSEYYGLDLNQYESEEALEEPEY